MDTNTQQQQAESMHKHATGDATKTGSKHVAVDAAPDAAAAASAAATSHDPPQPQPDATMSDPTEEQPTPTATSLAADSLIGSFGGDSVAAPTAALAAAGDEDLSLSDASDSDAERHEAAMQLRRRAVLPHAAEGGGDQLDGGDGGAATDGVAVAGGMASTAAAASHPLPSSLRLATLRLTPLHAHLLLFPSHKFDANYQNSMVPAAERRTSYETSDLASFPCPVLMNTPDSTHNWPYGLVEPDATPLDAAAAAAMAQTQQPLVSPSSSPAQSISPPVLGSPPPAFLLKSSSPAAAADDGPMRDGFVQCAKCSKWRTVPETVDAQSLPSPWTCDLNSWDPRSARCASMDEVFEEGELWAGMPKRFTRLVDHDAFYRRLVALLHQQHDEAVSAGAPLPAHIDNDSGELEKFPHIRRRPVDLFRTYTSVIQLGGYDKVSASNQWKIIQSCLHIPDQHDSSLTLKRLYKRFLYEYERTYWKNPRPQPATPASAAATSVPAAPAPVAASSSRSTRPTKQQPFSSSNTHSASVSSSAGAAAAAASSSAADSRKRRQKLMRSGSEGGNGGGGGGGGDESDEEMDAGARKRQRRLADLVDADEYGDGTALLDEEVSGDEEKAERLFDLQGRPLPSSVPRPTGNASPFAHMSAAVPVPTINAIGISVRNLRNAMDSKFRTLEKRMDDRFNKLESSIVKAIRDATQQVRDQATSVAHKQKARVHRLHKDQQRKSDLLAKGLNMIIAERLKAALPRLAHAKIKQHMKEEKDRINQLALQQQQQIDAAAAAVAAAAAGAAAVSPASAKATAPPAAAAAFFPLLPSAAASAAAALSSGAAGPVLLTPFEFMMRQQQLSSPTLNAAAVAGAAAAASAADVPASASNTALKTAQMTVKSETAAPAAAAAARTPPTDSTGPSPMQLDVSAAAATPPTDSVVASPSRRLPTPSLAVPPAAAAANAPIPPVAVLASPPAPALVDMLGAAPMPTSSPPAVSDPGAGHVMSVPFLGQPSSVPGGNGDVDKFLRADIADAE